MNEQLSIYDKAVYCVLCAYASNTNKSCYPSYQTIARKAGCSRRKVIDVIANLEAIGLIEKQEQFNVVGENKSNLYVVKTSASASYALPTGAEQSLPNAEDSPKLYSNNYNDFNYINPSIYPIDEMERLKHEIEYEYFEENLPDKLSFIDSLLGYIIELRREDNPQYRRLLSQLNASIILEFMEEMKGKSFKEVRNIKAYMKRTFIEYLRAQEMLLATIWGGKVYVILIINRNACNPTKKMV
jgi:biotin operon repressor